MALQIMSKKNQGLISSAGARTGDDCLVRGLVHVLIFRFNGSPLAIILPVQISWLRYSMKCQASTITKSTLRSIVFSYYKSEVFCFRPFFCLQHIRRWPRPGIFSWELTADKRRPYVLHVKPTDPAAVCISAWYVAVLLYNHVLFIKRRSAHGHIRAQYSKLYFGEMQQQHDWTTNNLYDEGWVGPPRMVPSSQRWLYART